MHTTTNGIVHDELDTTMCPYDGSELIQELNDENQLFFVCSAKPVHVFPEDNNMGFPIPDFTDYLSELDDE